MQSHTPKPMRAVPNRAYPTRVSSPRSIPNTAVAAKVVALVTGTASDIGALLRMAKKVAEAVRLSKKGRVYCQIERSLSHRRREERNLVELEEELRAWSQRRAPRRIRALVAPQTRPIATIFSTSPIIFFPSLSVQLSRNQNYVSKLKLYQISFQLFILEIFFNFQTFKITIKLKKKKKKLFKCNFYP